MKELVNKPLMITLYVKTGCPHCAKVLTVLNAYQIPFEEKNVSEQAVVDELISLGGKKQTPFLLDGDTMMYESTDIIAYLEEKYRMGADGKKKPKIHFAKSSGDVCPS